MGDRKEMLLTASLTSGGNALLNWAGSQLYPEENFLTRSTFMGDYVPLIYHSFVTGLIDTAKFAYMAPYEEAAKESAYSGAAYYDQKPPYTNKKHPSINTNVDPFYSSRSSAYESSFFQ